MNVIFPCSVLLLVIIVCWASSTSDSINGGSEAIERLLQETAERHKETFHRIHGRSKRFERNEQLYRDEGEPWTLKGFDHFRGCPGVLRQFQVFEINGLLFSITVTNAEKNNVYIHRFSLEQGCQELLTRLHTRMALDFALAKVNQGVRLIVIEEFSAKPLKRSGSQVYNLVLKNNTITVTDGELLSSDHPSCVTTWTQFGVPYVAICNSMVERSGISTYSGKSNIYRASGGYFDVRHDIETHNPQQIHYVNIASWHFLAVANHPNETEKEDFPTEIFLYNVDTGYYERYQSLPAKGAVDICSLTLGSGLYQEHYLVVVNQYSFDQSGEKDFDVSSYIYKFVNNKFQPFQSIRTHKATSCLTYQTDKDELVLMFATATGVASYQYDGWRFVPAADYTQHAMGPGLQKLKTSSIGNKLYIAASNGNPEMEESSNLFLPLFDNHPTLSGVYDETFKWCNNRKAELDKDPINTIVNLYPKAVKKNDTTVVLGSVEFGDISAEQVVVDELNIESDGIRIGLPVIRELQTIETKLDELQDKLEKLLDKQQNAIRSEGDYVINGPVNVKSLSSTCTDKCQVTDINAVRINGEDIDNLLSQTFYLTDDTVPSTLKFSSLVVNGDIDVPIVSGRKIGDYSQTDQDLHFTKPCEVTGNLLLDSSLDVSGLVNGKNITPSNLLLRIGDQFLDWELDAVNIEAPKLSVTTINDRNVSFFYENALSPRSSFKLVRPTFASSLQAENLTVTGLINEIDISDLFQNAMKVDGDQNITGSHLYNSVAMGSVTVEGEVNGQKLPDERLISISDDSVANLATLRLTGGASFLSLNVTADFAGLQLKDGRLDTELLLKNRNDTQVITGKKIFEQVDTEGNVTSDTVNKKTVPRFDTDSSIHGKPNVTLTYSNLNITGHAIFDKPLIAQSLSEIDLDRLKEKGVEINATEFPSFDSITFAGDVIIDGDLSAETINDVPKNDFILKNTTEPIILDGRKSFNNVTVNKSFQLKSLLNGHNLTEVWENSLHVDGDQTIDGRLVIDNDVSANVSSAGATPFVPLNNISKVSGIKHFGPVKIEGDIVAESIEATGDVDGVDIRSWPNDTLFKNVDNQTITGRKFFANLSVSDANVHAGENFDAGMFTDIVMMNEPAVINGDLEIQGKFHSADSVIKGALDGQENDLPLHLLRNGVDQNLVGGLTVEGPLKVDAFYDKSWTVNGINISKLLDGTIKTDQPANLPSFTFVNVVADNIVVGGTVQDEFQFPNDFVLKTSNKTQVVTGEKRFVGPVRSGSLEVANLVNDEDPRVLCENQPRQHSSKWIIHGDVIIEEESTIDIDSLNKVKLDELLSNVWLKDKDVTLDHNQNFSHVVIEGSVKFEGLVNEIDLADIQKRTISLSSPTEQVITGVHHFENLKASQLKVGDFEGESINGITLNDLRDSVLLRNVEQNIHNNIQFQDVVAQNVVVSGSVNGLDLNEDMMMKDKTNVVTGHKILDKIVVEGDMKVCENCTIGGVDVSYWGANAVRRTGNFTVSAPVNFEDITFENPLKLEGKLDGVQFDRDHLMTLNDTQEIQGNVTFSAKLPRSILRGSYLYDAYLNSTEGFSLSARIANLTVGGSYDGVNLTRLFDKAVHQNKEVTFTEPVTLSDLEAKEAEDKAINSTIRDILEETEVRLAELRVNPVKQSDIDAMLENINRIAPKLATDLQYFKEVANDLPLVTDADNVYPIQHSYEDRPVVCYYSSEEFQLYCGSSENPLLTHVRVTSVATSEDRNFAVTSVNSSTNETSATIVSYLESTSVIQTISLSNVSLSASVTTRQKSCFLFADSVAVKVHCRPTDSTSNYEHSQDLPLPDVRQMSVCYQKDGSPILAVRSGSQQSRVVILYPEGDDGTFIPKKTIVTPRIVSIDCACDDDQCYIATLSPSKPAAIPGDVMIWSLSNTEHPKRIQRISISEPNDVKFARLQDGRLSLFILQRTGIHNVLVYVWEGQSLFSHKTIVKVPGVQEMHIVSSKSSRLMLILTVKTPLSALAPKHSVRLFEGQYLGLESI